MTFCRAILDLQPGGDAMQAQAGFAHARKGLSPGDTLFWPSLRGEAHAWLALGQPATAAALCRDVETSLTETMPEDLQMISRSA